ncbi:hypothetical protein B0A48_01316 [Cryoendolithus antarcticus]|uniref:Uncharacterized protein n=1 Tax=Cryoendolithus antarcticus TaxID=1507870 RepID=A0A1V8TSW3_9PEZI|nr:hypothetical protein B0A48_01316 [Cryoendolithus antarcticus]
MGDDSPAFHLNNPRTRNKGRPCWERILGVLWPLSSCCESHGKPTLPGRQQMEKHIQIICDPRGYDSTPILSPYNDDEHLIARHVTPQSRKDLEHFITTLDHQVLTAEDESLVRQMEDVWNSLRARYSLSRSPSPPSPPPLTDPRWSFQEARAAQLDSRLTAGQESMLTRSGNYAKIRRVRCREHLRPDTSVHLRGGGDGEAPKKRARTTLPPPKAKTVLPDGARPHRLLWWLASGSVSRTGAPPTIGELRVRNEVELANREIVEFWGTAAGRRRVGKVGLVSASHEDVKAEVVEPVDAKEDSKA